MTDQSPQIRNPQSAIRNRSGRLPEMDWALLACAVALVGLGFVMVASASMAVADRTYGDAFHFVYRHGAALALALSAALVCFFVTPAGWQRYGPLLFFVGIGLLILVLIPGVGRSANGATRWIPLGPFNLQSSELMKFFAVIFVSGYLVRRHDEVATQLSGFIKPMVLMVMAATLIMAEPDFGTTAVLLATVLGLLFLGGVQVSHFAVLLGSVGVALVGLIVSSPYRMERVLSYREPFKDAFDTGFQLSQALIAFGRGEWLGVGLGNGIQKQFFLPEAHTDFIMAVIGEEFGLVGVLTVTAAFAFIVWRAFRIGARAERSGHCFEAYVAHGFGLGIGLQALVNIGVNVGLLPTKGLTLPFMSYGSNSLIVACMAIAVLLRIDMEQRRETADHGPVRGVKWARV